MDKNLNERQRYTHEFPFHNQAYNEYRSLTNKLHKFIFIINHNMKMILSNEIAGIKINYNDILCNYILHTDTNCNIKNHVPFNRLVFSFYTQIGDYTVDLLQFELTTKKNQIISKIDNAYSKIKYIRDFPDRLSKITNSSFDINIDVIQI